MGRKKKNTEAVQETVLVHSRTENFHRWGLTWGHGARRVGVVAELPDQSRCGKAYGVELLVTQAEIAKERSRAHPQYPLVVQDIGDADAGAEALEAAANARNALQRENDELQRVHDALSADITRMRKERDGLGLEIKALKQQKADLESAIAAAEEQAVEAEERAGIE